MKLLILTLSLPFFLLGSFNCGGRQLAENSQTADAEALKSGTSPVDWTVMVYLNGDNNLEKYALRDFREMSKVGSSDKINIVAQFDRIGYVPDYGGWTQTLRFKIAKDMAPTPENAVPGFNTEVNMGDGKILGDFVTWAMTNYPAKRYMLLIWDHGSGWRRFLNLRSNTPEAEQARNIEDLLANRANRAASLQVGNVQESPVKAVSHDETSGKSLYNREIQDTLGQVLAGKKLDVVGFDACLMSMVETGYAMRGIAGTMIGSEELEPGDGWRYDDWLAGLSANPTMDGNELGKVVVKSYQKQYSNVSDTTLSATDLREASRLADLIDKFAHAMESQFGNPFELKNIRTARDNCNNYGSGSGHFYNIDLLRFANLVANGTHDPSVRGAAQQVVADLAERVVIGNYAHESMQDDEKYGSHGLAIYFPATKSQFEQDPLSSAYRDANENYPVEFVKGHAWDNFLMSYFQNDH